jgi:hypothetical protein
VRALESYLAAQSSARAKRERETPRPKEPGLFVTVSRQAGAGGIAVAEELARILTERKLGATGPAWTVFDRALLETMATEHALPKNLLEELEEEGVAPIDSLAMDLFGIRPSVHDLVSMTSRTILHLAHLGNAILVGRGACLVARSLERGLHVRLVGSFWHRLQHVRMAHDLTAQEAEKLLEREDESHRRYLKRYFQKDIDDPLLYDLVINTDDLGHRRAALVIAEALRIKTSPPS